MRLKDVKTNDDMRHYAEENPDVMMAIGTYMMVATAYVSYRLVRGVVKTMTH